MASASQRTPTERQLALLVSSAVDYAIFLLDETGVVQTWNPGAERMKGYAEHEIVGRHFSTFYTETDIARDHPSAELEIAAREGRYQEEGWRVRKDGGRFWASIVITAIRDEDGRLLGFGKVSRDLTERKLAADALEAAVDELREVNEELDRFASVAAHDMSDPLRTITGFADLLAKDEVPPERVREFGARILDSGQRLQATLRSLLAYARAGRAAVDVGPVDVALVAREVLDDLAGLVDAAGADVAVEIPSGARMLGDARDVRLALQNLVSNALKHASVAAPAIRISATRDDGAWRVTVADNGVGLGPAEQGSIFTPFARAGGAPHGTGHGLGLAITQRLVERHGGRIGVDAEPGAGSRFWFAIPAA